MPAPRFQYNFSNDVFISYTHADDDADVTGRKWVSQFETDLRTRLAQVSGCSIATWRDNKLGAVDRFNDEIASQIGKSAVMVTILSPSYFRSDYCLEERQHFRSAAPDIGNKARIVKVAKTRVDLAAYPSDLKELLEHRFYLEESSGVCREFHLHEDPTVQRRYATRVDDVATEIAGLLKLLESRTESNGTKGVVFLAEATSDLDEPRAAIRRSLAQRGYEVVPNVPLRLLTALQIRESLSADLARAKAAVHPIGSLYGTIPELGAGASISRIQLELAASRQSPLPRLIWIPAGVEPREQPQSDLISQIHNQWAGNPFQVIEGPLEVFETNLLDALERPAAPAPIVEIKPVKKRPLVYLMTASDGDRRSSREIRFWLHGQDLDVEWPSRESDAAVKHVRHLTEDDGFLVYYGECSQDWVKTRVAEIAASEFSGRATRILARTVFLADPENDDKLDFLSHDAQILNGYGGIPVEKALLPFLSDIQAGWVPKSGSGERA
jgi:TIR domain